MNENPRITTDALYLQIATQISKRGTCGRLQVGCVIAVDKRIISTGYNGPLPNEPHCDLLMDPLANKLCKNESCIRAVHAEANAIYAAAKNGNALKGGTIYCTHSPCIDCAEAIVQAGIVRVYFKETFRDDTPVKRLRNSGVEVIQLEIDPITGAILNENIWY